MIQLLFALNALAQMIASFFSEGEHSTLHIIAAGIFLLVAEVADLNEKGRK